MADHQKIYPVDVEAPSTVPSVPNDTKKPETNDLIAPLTQTRRLKKRSCCCRFMCWTISLLFILVILLAAIVGILYLVFQPKLPKYSVDNLIINDFALNANSSLYTQVTVDITIRNPNKRIGIYYENGSQLSAYYSDIKFCEGSLPKFYQGHRNTTVLNVTLTGQTENATSLITSVTEQQTETGSVPLKLRAHVPVRVKLGKLKLMKIKLSVRCNLQVDSLTTTTDLISVRTNSCKFRIRL